MPGSWTYDSPRRHEPWGKVDHELKSHPGPFRDAWEGRKTFEYRRDDRDFAVGQILRLREYDPETHSYSGRWMDWLVPHLTRGPAFEIPRGYVVMSIADCFRDSAGAGDYDHGG